MILQDSTVTRKGERVVFQSFQLLSSRFLGALMVYVWLCGAATKPVTQHAERCAVETQWKPVMALSWPEKPCCQFKVTLCIPCILRIVLFLLHPHLCI